MIEFFSEHFWLKPFARHVHQQAQGQRFYLRRVAEKSSYVSASNADAYFSRKPDRCYTGSGLEYFGRRYLDAEVGVWTGTDPAGEYWSPYSYVGGDPINRFDPDGEATYWINRVLGDDDALPFNMYLSHSFWAITDDETGKVIHTYSWGPQGDLFAKNKTWAKDMQTKDRWAAQESIKKGFALKLGFDGIDPYMAQAYDQLRMSPKAWWLPLNNCKHRAIQLMEKAIGLQKEADRAAQKRAEEAAAAAIERAKALRGGGGSSGGSGTSSGVGESSSSGDADKNDRAQPKEPSNNGGGDSPSDEPSNNPPPADEPSNTPPPSGESKCTDCVT